MQTEEEVETRVRSLVETFSERSQLHEAYKEVMKEAIFIAFVEFGHWASQKGKENISEEDIGDWVDEFVEESFKIG